MVKELEKFTCLYCKMQQENEDNLLVRVRGYGMVHFDCIKVWKKRQDRLENWMRKATAHIDTPKIRKEALAIFNKKYKKWTE